MAQRMVKVQNMVNKTVSIKKPEYGINRRWTQKGQIIPLPYEAVEQMLWDNGVRVMIDRGILYIPDMKDKIDLGLEPEDATEPVNIIVLSDNDMKRMMTAMPQFEFEAKIKTLNYEQMLALADYAIKNELGDYNKCDVIKKACGKDILTAIRLNREDKEG